MSRSSRVRVHLVNPSSVSFGTAVITPRWQYVLAGATPKSFGDPILVDETLSQIKSRDYSGGRCRWNRHPHCQRLRGYEIGKLARSRGAYVIFGGIHATLYPQEAVDLGGAHSVVKGDGDMVWAKALQDCRDGIPQSIYLGGQIEASDFVPARWDLIPRNKYMWASVQTVRGCPKHCSFCSVWRTDGSVPASAHPTPSSRKSSSCGAWVFVLSRSPTITSTPSLRLIWSWLASKKHIAPARAAVAAQ